MIIRLLLLLACSVSGYFIVYHYDWGFPTSLLGLVAGLIVALSVIQIEQAIRKVSIRVIFGGVASMFIGLLIASFALRAQFCYHISENVRSFPDLRPADRDHGVSGARTGIE